MEEQLRRSRRMEAIRKLTGDVEHDFNNLPTEILGCADVATDDNRIREPSSQTRKYHHCPSQNACCEALGLFGTPDLLLRSRVTTLIETCRSERKAEDNQQVVTNADQLLAPSLSTLSGRFATICHNYYYVFMTAAWLGRTDARGLARFSLTPVEFG